MFSCSGSGVRTAPAHCFLLGSPPGSRLSSELSLARRRLGLRVTRWFLRALHALASFLLAQGIALSERKSSPSRVEPPGKCSSLPCAPDGGGGGPETEGHGQESRRDPDLRAEAGEVRFITEGLGSFAGFSSYFRVNTSFIRGPPRAGRLDPVTVGPLSGWK